MTDRKHPDTVARFLDGTMSASERAGFEARLARDGALRMHVDAERAIRATIEQDVATMPVDHDATRAGMMAALASLPKPPASTPGSSGTTTPTPISPLLRWLGIAGAGTAVIVGAWLVSDRDERPSFTAPGNASSVASDSPARAPLAQPNTASTRAPFDTDSSQTGARGGSAASGSAASGSGASRGAVGSPAAAPAQGSIDSRGGLDARGTSQGRAVDADQPAGRGESTPTATTAQPRKLRVIEGDSIKVRVGVEDIRQTP